jgi:hypothetical protein
LINKYKKKERERERRGRGRSSEGHNFGRGVKNIPDFRFPDRADSSFL